MVIRLNSVLYAYVFFVCFFFLVENRLSLNPPPLRGKFHYFFFEPFPKISTLYHHYINGYKYTTFWPISDRKMTFWAKGHNVTKVIKKQPIWGHWVWQMDFWLFKGFLA